MGTVLWGPEIAEAYDTLSAAMFEPAVLDPAVDLLAELAGDGPALELAVGTGRVALPLSARGVEVHGIELSPHMAAQLRAKPGADAVPVTIGDMTTTRVDGLLHASCTWCSTRSRTSPRRMSRCPCSRTRPPTSRPVASFVVELGVPQLRRMPASEVGRVFTLEDDHVGIDTIDDLVGQIQSSHHWWTLDGRLLRHSAPYRYIWPAELDLMARLAGLRLRHRWADWDRSPFTSESESQVA